MTPLSEPQASWVSTEMMPTEDCWTINGKKGVVKLTSIINDSEQMAATCFLPSISWWYSAHSHHSRTPGLRKVLESCRTYTRHSLTGLSTLLADRCELMGWGHYCLSMLLQW